MAEETWDLAEVVSERKQPTAKVGIYLNEEASHTKVQIMAMYANAKTDEVQVLDDKLEALEKLLESSKYTVHLQGIPARMREDINTQAFVAFPAKPDFLGRDDPMNARDRQRKEGDLLWLAHITDVVNPRGKSKKDWTEGSIHQFASGLPLAAQNAIDAAIKKLAEDSEKFTVEAQNPDF